MRTVWCAREVDVRGDQVDREVGVPDRVEPHPDRLLPGVGQHHLDWRACRTARESAGSTLSTRSLTPSTRSTTSASVVAVASPGLRDSTATTNG